MNGWGFTEKITIKAYAVFLPLITGEVNIACPSRVNTYIFSGTSDKYRSIYTINQPCISIHRLAKNKT